MLTSRDEQLQEQTGMVPPDRLRSLEHALRCLSRDARSAACDHPDGPKSHAAAALRGKAGAYVEAAIMARHIANGQALHPRAYSTERRLSRAFAARRRARRDGGA